VGSLTIESVRKAEQARVVATLVSAFIADPVERWLFSEPLAYLTHFPAFVAAFGGEAFERQTVWGLEDFAAVAMWIPPGTESDGDAIVAALSESVAAEKHTDTFSVLEQMDAAHRRIRTGICPGLGSIAPTREPALARPYSSNAWCASTPITAPPSLKRPTRERCRSMSATGSESPTSRKPEHVRP
jgi:hypothetical protein